MKKLLTAGLIGLVSFGSISYARHPFNISSRDKTTYDFKRETKSKRLFNYILQHKPVNGVKYQDFYDKGRKCNDKLCYKKTRARFNLNGVDYSLSVLSINNSYRFSLKYGLQTFYDNNLDDKFDSVGICSDTGCSIRETNLGEDQKDYLSSLDTILELYERK